MRCFYRLRACAPFEVCEKRLRLGAAKPQQSLLCRVAPLPVQEGRRASGTAPTLVLATTLDTGTLNLATTLATEPPHIATLPLVRGDHPPALLDGVDRPASAERRGGASRACRACRACRRRVHVCMSVRTVWYKRGRADSV